MRADTGVSNGTASGVANEKRAGRGHAARCGKLASDRRFIADGSERKLERTLMIEQRERLVGTDTDTCCEEAWKPLA